jgi:hypothetical protein
MAKESDNYLDIGFNEFLDRVDEQGALAGEFALGQPSQYGATLGSLGASGSGGDSVELEIKDGASLSNLWITNDIKSKDWKPRSTGFYMNGDTGYAEFSNVYVSGTITATTGDIGGWVIGTDRLTGTKIALVSGAANVARVEVGSGSNVAGINSALLADEIAFWAGASHLNRTTANFRVELNGDLTASNADITGVVNATTLTATGTGDIGGWTIGSTTLTGGGVTLDSAGTITGGTIQTAFGDGARIVMDSSGIDSFDSSNNLRFAFFQELLTFKKEPPESGTATVATMGSIVSGFEILMNYDGTFAANGGLALLSDFNDTGDGLFSIDSGKDSVLIKAGNAVTYGVPANAYITLQVRGDAASPGPATGIIVQLQEHWMVITTTAGGFAPTNAGLLLGYSDVANRWAVGYINKISGLGTANVIDFGISGHIATNQDFRFADIITTAENPSALAGAVHWNSTTSTLRVHDGSNWRSLAYA